MTIKSSHGAWPKMITWKAITVAASLALGNPTVAEGYPEFASPADFGVPDYAYKVSETDFNILRSLAKAPVNEWAHQEDVSNVATQQVIRENQDVIYSSAVVARSWFC
jgi:hypothetical protein